MLLRPFVLVLVLGALPAAELSWRQWRVVADGQISLSSGGTAICTLGSWPGAAEVRDGALVFAGRTDDADITAMIRIADGIVTGRVSRRRQGRPATDGQLFATFAAGDLAGGTVVMDGQPVRIGTAFTHHEYPHAGSYGFFADQPAKRLALRFDRGRFSNLRDFRNEPGRNDMQVFMLFDDEGEIGFTIDLTGSQDTGRRERFTGERFAWQDDLRLFDRGNQPNRIANPSFEAGWDEWGWGITDFADPPGRTVWAVDDGIGRSGRRSARYTVARGFHPRMLCSRALAVEPGKPITVSYWARSDRPGAGAHLFVSGVTWADFPVVRYDAYTAEWQRFSATFTPKGPFLRVCLGDHWWADTARQVDGANIWFDDVQLEDGPAAGPFSQLPMHACSDTGTAGQLLALGAGRPGLAVRVFNTSGAPAVIATTVRIQDAQRRTLQEDSFSSTLPAWGAASHALALEPGDVRGLLRVEMQLDGGGQRIVRHGRVCLYEPITDVGRLRYGLRLEQPSVEQIRALQPLGVSGSLGFAPLADPAAEPALRTAGWMHITGPYVRGFPFDFYKQPRPDAAAWTAFSDWFAPIAAAHPGQMWWKTFNEPNCGGHLATAADLVAGVAAIRARVKAVNPQAMILTPDPYNASRGGQGWLEEFLAAGGARVVDAIAIHSYRARPEDPDLDQDIQGLIALKAKHGLGAAPILFTEGEGYQRYTVPEVGVSPFGFWDWRMGTLGNDLGRSELTAAALMSRTLLACLKNDPVRLYLSWTDGDADEVPHATLASVNWLLARLRHATFAREFAIGDDLRAYLFTTPDQRSVAAVWSTSLPVDRGEKPGIDLDVALPSGTEVRDFFGTPLPAAAGGRLRIDGHPTYLLGGPGSAERLAAALAAGNVDGLSTTMVDTTLRLDGAAGLAVAVRNRLTHPLRGALDVAVAGKAVDRAAMDLAAKQVVEQRVPLPPIAANRMVDIPVALAFTEEGGSLNRREERLRRLAIPRLEQTVAIDGDDAEWAGVPAIDLDARARMAWGAADPWKGVGDLSARIRFGWRDDGLYLLAQVADDVHLQAKSPEDAWRQDSLQLYVDLLADGRDRPGSGYDANDETFSVSAAGGGPGRIWRDYTPEWQIGFVKHGPVDAPCVVKRSGNVTTYELRLPAKELFPLAMKPGTAFGCALIVNDADGEERTQALVTTPVGTEPHARPELWPAVVLLP